MAELNFLSDVYDNLELYMLEHSLIIEYDFIESQCILPTKNSIEFKTNIYYAAEYSKNIG